VRPQNRKTSKIRTSEWRFAGSGSSSPYSDFGSRRLKRGPCVFPIDKANAPMVGAPWASFWNRVRSRSRGARYSTSSIMGWWRRRAKRSLALGRRSWRSVIFRPALAKSLRSGSSALVAANTSSHVTRRWEPSVPRQRSRNFLGFLCAGCHRPKTGLLWFAKKPISPRIRAVSPSRWDREKPLSSSGESPTNRGAAGELTLAQSVYAPPRAARAPEMGAVRLVRVWHRMFNGGTISGGTG